MLIADTWVHGDVYDAEAVADRARSVEPGGSGSGFCAMTHCSALTAPDALSGALYVVFTTSPLPPVAPAASVPASPHPHPRYPRALIIPLALAPRLRPPPPPAGQRRPAALRRPQPVTGTSRLPQPP